jgi:hypothetical protein
MQFPIASILAGLLLLFFGRRLFWLFVALIGFSAGMILSSELFSVRSQLMVFVIGIACGLVGAVIAIFLQRLAIGIAGFLSGAMIGVALAGWFGIHASPMIPGLIGGILGALLLSMLFDWALIFLSVIVGASLILHSITLEARFVIPAFFVLALVGVFVQSRFITGHRRAPASP